MFGNTYEKAMYEKAIQHRLVDPLTNQPLPEPDGGPVHPNRVVRAAVEAFLSSHPGYVPHGWPSTPAPAAPCAAKLARDFTVDKWDQVQGNCRIGLCLWGCLRMAISVAFAWRSVLPEYEPRSEQSKEIRHVSTVMGMAAGLSAGRIGWGLAIRLVRALSGVWPLSPIRLIENPDHGFRAWLRAAYRLTCPMPLNWGHVLGGELLLGRFWILQFLIKEAVWAKLPNSILYAAKLCKEDLSHGLVQPLIGHAMIMTPLAIFACGHFVVAGREIGWKCATKRMDELEQDLESKRVALLSSMSAAVAGNARVVSILGALYGISALLLHAILLSIRSTQFAIRLRRQTVFAAVSAALGISWSWGRPALTLTFADCKELRHLGGGSSSAECPGGCCLPGLHALRELKVDADACVSLASVDILSEEMQALTSVQLRFADCTMLTSLEELTRPLGTLTEISVLEICLAGCVALRSLGQLGAHLHKLSALSKLRLNLFRPYSISVVWKWRLNLVLEIESHSGILPRLWMFGLSVLLVSASDATLVVRAAYHCDAALYAANAWAGVPQQLSVRREPGMHKTVNDPGYRQYIVYRAVGKFARDCSHVTDRRLSFRLSGPLVLTGSLEESFAKRTGLLVRALFAKSHADVNATRFCESCHAVRNQCWRRMERKVAPAQLQNTSFLHWTEVAGPFPKDDILDQLQLLVELAGEDACTKSHGADVLGESTVEGLVDLVASIAEDSEASEADVLLEALSLLRTDLREDAHVQQLLAEIQGAEQGGSTPSSVVGQGVTGDEVITGYLDVMVMEPEQARELQDAWVMFMESFSSRDVACDTLFVAFYDAAPSLQSLFKTSRAIMSGRLTSGIESIVMALPNGKEVKGLVEALGFKHLEIEVTSPRIAVFREAILEAFTAELGDRFTTLAYEGLRKTLNYAGGGCVYLRETFAERLQILASSWRTASADGQVLDEEWDEDFVQADSARGSGSQATSQSQQSQLETSQTAVEVQPATGEDTQHENPNKISMQGVPTSFNEMFRFNAAVMGMADREWMYEVLDCFDAIVRNVANTFRLQEECDVLSLRFAKVPGVVILVEFKAVMLASLRSLVPQDWNTKHEEAWDWLWSNVEKMLGKEIGKAADRERRVSRYVGSMEDETKCTLSKKIYTKFFTVAPEGQNYFKQSSTRLQFIIDRVVEMTLSMYQSPCRMVDEISALGLRHVGYGIPTEFFNPFVQCCVDVMREITNDAKLCDAFAWSLGLVSRILVRTINEGSTLVMKAINMNSANMVRKALVPVPRSRRALSMLKVTVGTQSISPLLWAISSGGLEAAHEMLADLLTIRADRDRYYFGNDDLFARHPDIVQVLTKEAPTLLEVLLDKLVWRSRLVVGGQRRVNIFLKHLLVDAEGQFAEATRWIYQTQDPILVVHCVLETLTDLVWTNVIYGPFLRSKVWLLFTLLVFLMSQSILKTWHTEDETTQGTLRILTAACRAFVYFASMLELIYSRTRISCKAFREGDVVRRFQVPLPMKVVTDWQETMSWLLTLFLIAMFMVEPILYCLQSDGDFPDAGLFTQNCPAASDVRDVYAFLSMLAMFCYFTLLVDFSALFVRCSAFVMISGQVLPELVLMLGAVFYLILVFGCTASTSSDRSSDFANIFQSALSFFRISIGMYPAENFHSLQYSRWIMVMCVGFTVLVVIFLSNVLIAQLIGAYSSLYDRMLGLARLNRMAIICDSMPSVRRSRFQRFIARLRLDERTEFGEGDVGLPGCIQVLEPGNLNPTNQDTIKRYGGSTSPKMPWPDEEEEVSGSMAERLDNLTKLWKKAMRRIEKKRDKGGRRDGGSSASESDLNRSRSSSSANSDSSQ
ncbi:unnamed protein product [Symbiodinium natans]|uniref:Uncharacterized protein n=1 Tax=Symbiodinium natans TaxID=878477 RepID=A0A812PZV1_9DINO|nr:unnamed protein product [Symbiodinium natans]